MERRQVWIVFNVSHGAWRLQAVPPEEASWAERIRTSHSALGRWLPDLYPDLCGLFFFMHWHHTHVSTTLSSHLPLSRLGVSPTCSVSSHLNTLVSSHLSWCVFQNEATTGEGCCWHPPQHTHTHIQTHYCWMKSTPATTSYHKILISLLLVTLTVTTHFMEILWSDGFAFWIIFRASFEQTCLCFYYKPL